MMKKLVPPFLLLAFLLAACSSQTTPDLVNCKQSGVGYCTPRVDWIALPAQTGKMRVLYEDERAIVYVNPNNASAARLLSRPRLFRRFGKDEIVQIISLASSGDIAVYDKVRKSCVTSVGTNNGFIEFKNCTPVCGGQYKVGLYLPDCTPILYWGGAKIVI